MVQFCRVWDWGGLFKPSSLVTTRTFKFRGGGGRFFHKNIFGFSLKISVKLSEDDVCRYFWRILISLKDFWRPRSSSSDIFTKFLKIIQNIFYGTPSEFKRPCGYKTYTSKVIFFPTNISCLDLFHKLFMGVISALLYLVMRLQKVKRTKKKPSLGFNKTSLFVSRVWHCAKSSFCLLYEILSLLLCYVLIHKKLHYSKKCLNEKFSWNVPILNMRRKCILIVVQKIQNVLEHHIYIEIFFEIIRVICISNR